MINNWGNKTPLKQQVLWNLNVALEEPTVCGEAKKLSSTAKTARERERDTE